MTNKKAEDVKQNKVKRNNKAKKVKNVIVDSPETEQGSESSDELKKAVIDNVEQQIDISNASSVNDNEKEDDNNIAGKKEQFEFGTETAKLLKLVIHSIYTNRNIFLRELISNSVDAINKRKYISLTNDALSAKDNDYKITIKINEKNKYLTVKDNGIGMNKQDLTDNLGVIARSGTEQFISQLKDNQSNSSDLIGQFGLGFYSAFMVGDKVQVKTKKIGEGQAWLWESDGQGTFSISEIDPFLAEGMDYGTEVKIFLNKESVDTYLEKYHLEHIIKTYSSNSGVKIIIKEEGLDKEIEVTKGVALWQKDKKDITQEEYKEFYKSISHLPDSPQYTIHYKAEGTVSFTSLLFVPSMKPFDLFNPNRSTRIKLYVRKIFINEENIDIFPAYLRFVQGIIESDDLQLNISRETFQNNQTVAKVKEVVTKKVLSELKSHAKNDPEGYLKFWDNFGQVIKEGLCESSTDRESLLLLSRFYTSKSPDKFTSLQDYIDRLVPNQKQIFFCIGKSPEEIMNNPQMEVFLKNNIEVFFLTEIVDGFWTNVVHNYQNYDFMSISRSDVDIKGLIQDSGQDEAKEKNENEEENVMHAKMVKAFETSLSGMVSAVQISSKLTDSPACLSIKQGAMDITMEKFLIEQNQLKSASLKMLEINPDNKLVKEAYENLMSEDESLKEKGKEISTAIFELACLAQGETLNNPSSFVKRVINLLHF